MASSLAERLELAFIESVPDTLPFRHTTLRVPLKDIRLVTILPALNHTDNISCTIHHSDIDCCGDFEALSYVWGDPTQTTLIKLDKRDFAVTTNLSHALRHLRRISTNATDARSFWIDAICIDQLDVKERNQQVRRMGRIYRQARRVVIWLGRHIEPEDFEVNFGIIWNAERREPLTRDSVQKAFELVESLATACDPHTHMIDVTLNPEITTNSVIWYRLFVLLRRSWFERLWVYQEATLARDIEVQCGHCTVHWGDFVVALLVIGASIRTGNFFGNDEEKFMQLYVHNLAALGFVTTVSMRRKDPLLLVRDAQSLKCLDPRDILFGMLSVMQKPDRQDIKVDYSKSVEQTYTDWARNRIQRTSRLDVFSLCRDSHNRGLPSWVPDLKASPEHHSFSSFFEYSNNYTHNQKYGAPYFSTGNCYAQLWPNPNNPHILALVGYKIDTITALSSDPIHDLSASDQNSELRWENSIKRLDTFINDHLGKPPVSGTSYYKAFADTIFMGKKARSNEDTRTFGQIYSAFRCQNFDLRRDCSPLEQSLLRSTILRDAEMFITSKGYIGLINIACHAAVGDSVQVLLGGNTPYILRQIQSLSQPYNPGHQFTDYMWAPGGLMQEDGSQQNKIDFDLLRHFHLMGPCYVHG